MRGHLLLTAGFCLVSLSAMAQTAPGAEVKVGLGVEKTELTGENTAFKVAAGTKLYAWTKVTGCAESKVIIAISKGEGGSKMELNVPRSPYRTYAYRTFRAGDDGEWTAKVLSTDGKELGTAKFTVTVEK